MSTCILVCGRGKWWVDQRDKCNTRYPVTIGTTDQSRPLKETYVHRTSRRHLLVECDSGELVNRQFIIDQGKSKKEPSIDGNSCGRVAETEVKQMKHTRGIIVTITPVREWVSNIDKPPKTLKLPRFGFLRNTAFKTSIGLSGFTTQTQQTIMQSKFKRELIEILNTSLQKQLQHSQFLQYVHSSSQDGIWTHSKWAIDTREKKHESLVNTPGN